MKLIYNKIKKKLRTQKMEEKTDGICKLRNWVREFVVRGFSNVALSG